ncbi:MAG: IS66 family insertion sequence element accessory protein TnpB [Gammaproteobacteria bacterium]|nr:IS66 family insertion sequence element accessory protein TnpB [Gammaproteobacteria bacterium]
MIHLTSQSRIQLAIKPQDFRKQIDGLVAVTRQKLARDPRSGALFVFINRSRTMIRILSYQGDGYWIATKRLTKGRFEGWPTSGSICEVSAKHLSTLIKGIISSDLVSLDKID